MGLIQSLWFIARDLVVRAVVPLVQHNFFAALVIVFVLILFCFRVLFHDTTLGQAIFAGILALVILGKVSQLKLLGGAGNGAQAGADLVNHAYDATRACLNAVCSEYQLTSVPPLCAQLTGPDWESCMTTQICAAEDKAKAPNKGGSPCNDANICVEKEHTFGVGKNMLKYVVCAFTPGCKNK